MSAEVDWDKVARPSFMTVKQMITICLIEEEAKADGREFEEELDDVAVKLYRVMRAQLDVKANDIEPHAPLNESATDDELFG